MTPSRFFFARLLSFVGLGNKTKRMTEAAGELHLLREAEEILGYFCWKRAEHIDAVSTEYWSIRKYSNERKELQGAVDNASDQLSNAYHERMTILDSKIEEDTEMIEQREKLIDQTEELAIEREAYVEEARQIKHRYEGLKTKSNVLVDEGNTNSEEFEKLNSEIEGIKASFYEVKEKRLAVTAKIEALDAQINGIDDKIASKKLSLQKEASHSFQNIGLANREVSTNRSKIGLIDSQIALLYTAIGSHISRFSKDEQCRSIAKEHKVLISQIEALRDSITLNNRIAEIS